MAVLVTGGARSGKSRFAEQLAMRKYKSGYYIATSEALDQEMSERILKHRLDREQSGFPWHTIETALELTASLKKLSLEPAEVMMDSVVLVDCLTLWLSNWFFALDVEHQGTEQLDSAIHDLEQAIQQYPYPLIIVSNEIGDGIVPMDALSRLYRDEAGRLNQRIALLCQQVFLVTAGIPLDIKALAYQWEEI